MYRFRMLVKAFRVPRDRTHVERSPVAAPKMRKGHCAMTRIQRPSSSDIHDFGRRPAPDNDARAHPLSKNDTIEVQAETLKISS